MATEYPGPARDRDRLTPPFSHPRAVILRRLGQAMEAVAASLPDRTDGRVVDVGCGVRPYESFFRGKGRYLGIDLPGNPDADVFVSPEAPLPLSDGSASCVVSSQVLEHVLDPRHHLMECARICSPGGSLVLSTHGVWPWHPDPLDEGRWTSSSLRRLVEDAGFEVVHWQGVLGVGATGLQLMHDWLLKRLPARPGRLRSMCTWFLQHAIDWVDRRTPPEERDTDAAVFLLVGRRR